MTAARITHHQAHQPAERRNIIGFLLLTGIEYTDARPWIGFVGAAVTGLVGATVLKVLA